MLNKYFVVDDFYDKPDELVKAALSCAKEDKSAGNYAGVMTSSSFLGQHHKTLFQNLLNEQSINPATDANGRIRFSKESDHYSQHIHFDGGINTKWSGVVYLSKSHPSIEGTAFWKHLKTDLEEIPKTVEGFSKYGWNTSQDLKNFLETDGVDETKWEKTFSIPYKYNRLVLFRPWLFHSPGPAFGDSLETSRMVQTIFLKN